MRELRLRVLGPFEVEGVEPHRLGSRKARTLCKVLALAHGRPVGLDRLVECVWPERPPARPSVDVAVLISRLRSVLGAGRLARSDAGYALVADWLDLVALTTLVEEASARLGAGSWSAARAAAAGALALDRGPLLADEPDAPWAELERASAARLMAQARHTSSLAALATGDPLGAADVAEALLDHDPYDEAALRTLMAAHATAGRPASALAAYARVRVRLGEDLGVEPAPATEAVHTAIVREQPIPGIVIGTSPTHRFRVAPADGQETLPGRAAELAALDAALAGAGGELTIVAIEGEAGIGKTRLLSVWSGRARDRGATVLAGRCDELDRTLPLEAVFSALERHLRAAGPEAATRLLGPDATVLDRLLGRRSADEPDVAGPSTPGGATSMAALADPGSGRTLLFDALLRVFTRLAEGGPTVLLLDDAHRAGAFTVDWLRFLSRRAPAVPLLVVVARRPEEEFQVTATGLVTLGPLGRADAEAVVGPDRVDELYARSGGHPLFLVELAAAEPGEELPASIRDAVAERCDRAGPSASATLRTAAVIGSDVDLDLLAAVRRLPPVDLLDHLEEGVRRRFLLESESGFAFRHELVREALASGAGASRRALIHREAGRALAVRSHPDPLAVAYHARLGGDHERAAGALIDAARLALLRSDPVDAERRLDQALILADLPDVRLERARLRTLRRNFDGAAEDAQVALSQGGGAAALETAGWVAYHARDFARARRLADDGARLADDPSVRASCLSLAAQVRTAAGELTEAEARLEEASRLAQGPSRVVVGGWLGTLRVYQGRAAEGLELLHPVTVPGAPGAGLFGLRVRGMVGYALALLGRTAEAMAAFDDLEAEMDRQGTHRYQGLVDNSRGWVLRNLGSLSAADEANERGLEVASRFATSEPKLSTEQRVHGLLDLAAGRLQSGDAAGAGAYLAEVEPLQQVEHSLRWRHQLRARLLGGRLALAQGAHEDALAAAADLVEQAAGLGAARYVRLARLLEARTRAAAGEPIEVAEVAVLLESLPAVAGLEAWWLTAEMAQAVRVDAWWGLAERRVAELAAAAGSNAETLRRHAAAQLERMRKSAPIA
jgi:DNA-binding SARP family transcriptional activator